MANDGTGAPWDEADPADNALVSNSPTQQRDLRIGLRLRLAKEHTTPSAATAGGEHKAGSAMIYPPSAGVPPTLRPDGVTVLTAADNGRVWNDSGILKYYVHPATWTAFTTVSTGLALAVLTHQVAIGTGGGTFTTGSWVTRVLNTEFDPPGIVTLAANQFVLGAGTFRVRAWANAYRVNAHITRLQNITDGATALFGSSEVSSNSSNTAQSRSEINGTFVLAGAKTFELQHRCETTQATNGRGYPALAWGGNEVHAAVEIVKLS